RVNPKKKAALIQPASSPDRLQWSKKKGINAGKVAKVDIATISAMQIASVSRGPDGTRLIV
ncbi:MAG: hypothetical protein WD185_04855, partial [Sneathiella sp.]